MSGKRNVVECQQIHSFGRVVEYISTFWEVKLSILRGTRCRLPGYAACALTIRSKGYPLQWQDRQLPHVLSWLYELGENMLHVSSPVVLLLYLPQQTWRQMRRVIWTLLKGQNSPTVLGNVFICLSWRQTLGWFTHSWNIMVLGISIRVDILYCLFLRLLWNSLKCSLKKMSNFHSKSPHQSVNCA